MCRAGRFTLAPAGGKHVTRQMYLPGTAILVTRFLSPGGVAEVVDFMPVQMPQVATDRHRLIRIVTGIRGQMTLEARVEPRFDYGRAAHKTHVTAGGVVFDGGSPVLSLSSTWPVEADGDDARARFTVRAGETGAMILESGKSPRPVKIAPRQLRRWYSDTSQYWRNWLARGTYRGRWREAVERSAITFFFSSRRRHTRLTCDWSSDVCSSDLADFFSDDSTRISSSPGRRTLS